MSIASKSEIDHKGVKPGNLNTMYGLDANPTLLFPGLTALCELRHARTPHAALAAGEPVAVLVQVKLRSDCGYSLRVSTLDLMRALYSA
jgi:hypothetical protein